VRLSRSWRRTGSPAPFAGATEPLAARVLQNRRARRCGRSPAKPLHALPRTMRWRRTFVAHVPMPGAPRAKQDRAAHRGSKGVVRVSSRVALRPLGCGQDNSLWTAALGAITPRKDENRLPKRPVAFKRSFKQLQCKVDTDRRTPAVDPLPNKHLRARASSCPLRCEGCLKSVMPSTQRNESNQ
jgi:hypothetical protein